MFQKHHDNVKINKKRLRRLVNKNPVSYKQITHLLMYLLTVHWMLFSGKRFLLQTQNTAACFYKM